MSALRPDATMATPASTSITPSSVPSSTTSTPSSTTFHSSFTVAVPGSSPGMDTIPPGADDASVHGRSVFYFLAFLGVVFASAYIFYAIRKDRRRRAEAARGDQEGDDLESGGRPRRYSSTHRPGDEGDEACPPQYRAYVLDQPFVEPEMTAIHRMQWHSHDSQQGLLDHMGLPASFASDLHDRDRPLSTFSTASSVVGPPLTIRPSFTAPPAPPSESPEPTSIRAPSPVITLSAERHATIMRSGLGGSSGNIHHHLRSSTSCASVSSGTPSVSSPRSASPATLQPISDVTQRRDSQRLGETTVPILYRLRSQGPPPYIPLAPEQAPPQLPPDYASMAAI